MNWNYTQPVEIIFGNGRISELKDIAKSKEYRNGLLVSDPFFVENGLAYSIKNDSEGMVVDIFSNISANPDVKEVDACADMIKKNNIGFIVALGGGSALDLAKAASSICKTSDSIRVYHGTGVPITEEHLPVIAVPTTSGTGSEVTSVSVLTDHDLGIKAPIVSKGFYPVCALIDPELTYSLPPYVTACTGIDVLSHALEGYWSKGNQPICDAMAVHAMDLVFKYLYLAYSEPSNVIAREKMAEASVIAGLAFTLPKTTSSHACSYPLTNIYGIPHGEACGFTLDYFTKINARYDDGRIKQLANKLGFKDGIEMADAICELKEKVKLRTDLKDLNLSAEQIQEIVTISRHPNLYNNPVDITDEMLTEMYLSFC